MSFPVNAYGVTSLASKELKPITIARRTPGPKDIQLKILYCGVCHSDIHMAFGEWKTPDGTPFTKLPCVPGHEILGQVTFVGDEVKSFKVGDYAGVGCLVDSCRSCEACQDHQENLCDVGGGDTYNGNEPVIGGHTYGGYSSDFVVNEDYGIHIPASMQSNLAAVAPLLCAGVTTYSPLARYGAGPGKKVGVVGLGGLGHMAVKIAKAMGAEVVLFTTSPSKIQDGLRLGATKVVVSKNADEMATMRRSLDLIIDCVSADHNINEYLGLLRRNGNLVLVGLPENPQPISAMALVQNNVHLAGSLIGGIKETQEMIDFCAEHGILSDIEMINIEDINNAYTRVLKSDVKYRFVIDMDSIRK